MKLPGYSRADILRGMLIYPAGDTAAALLTTGFSLPRLLGIMVVGALLYAWEIPAWFNCIGRRYTGIARTSMAVIFFNPLWIARHLAFISLFSGETADINSELLMVALKGFALNLPVSFAGNYLIQNRISLRWRFFSSAVFSSLLAVYYPLCKVLFK